MSIFDELARAYDNIERGDLPGTARHSEIGIRSRPINETVAVSSKAEHADFVRWAWDESPSTGRREQARVLADLVTSISRAIRRHLSAGKRHEDMGLAPQLSVQ